MENNVLRNRIIDSKLHEIDRVYNYKQNGPEKHVRCFCMGHSSGADALVELSIRDNSTQRILILLGAIKHIPLSFVKCKPIYFNAKIDTVLSMPSEDKH